MEENLRKTDVRDGNAKPLASVLRESNTYIPFHAEIMEKLYPLTV